MRLLHSVGGTGRTRVLLSLIRLYSTYGNCTSRAIAADTGMANMTVHHHLTRLRRDDLCAWENGCSGTLRPLVRRVA